MNIDSHFLNLLSKTRENPEDVVEVRIADNVVQEMKEETDISVRKLQLLIENNNIHKISLAEAKSIKEYFEKRGLKVSLEEIMGESK